MRVSGWRGVFDLLGVDWGRMNDRRKGGNWQRVSSRYVGLITDVLCEAVAFPCSLVISMKFKTSGGSDPEQVARVRIKCY